VDITKGPMEVGPTCHYMMGGIRVAAETGESTLSGLFAVGEAAGWTSWRESPRRQFALRSLGVLVAAQVFAAAQHAKRSSTPSIDNAQIKHAESELLAPFSNSGGEKPLCCSS